MRPPQAVSGRGEWAEVPFVPQSRSTGLAAPFRSTCFSLTKSAAEFSWSHFPSSIWKLFRGIISFQSNVIKNLIWLKNKSNERNEDSLHSLPFFTNRMLINKVCAHARGQCGEGPLRLALGTLPKDLWLVGLWKAGKGAVPTRDQGMQKIKAKDWKNSDLAPRYEQNTAAAPCPRERDVH